MNSPRTFGAHSLSEQVQLGRVVSLLDESRTPGRSKLPSESEISRRLDLDRAQVHRLLQVLAREGTVYAVKGHGWYFQQPKLEIPVARHNSYTANMIKLSKVPRSELIGVDQVRAGESDWWTDPQDWLWELDFRRYDGNLAFSLARIQVPVRVAPGLQRLLSINPSLYGALKEQFGIVPNRRRTWCESVAADDNVGESLGVPVGTPLLRVTHHAEWDGEPIEKTVNYLRGDACRVRFDLADGQEECP